MKDTHKLSKQVGLWIRVSTEDQAQGDSPEHHEHRARMYAEMKGWDVVKVYSLEAVSGKSVKEHPLTKEMIEDVKMGRISGLIFSKLARLARNTKELLEFADSFEEFNADLISLQEAIDTSSPAGRLFYTMIAAMAQWEREEISARVAASVPVRATLGKPLGGPAPFGYQWVDGTIEIEPNEAPVLRKMFELFLVHRRKKKVARLLNEAGHRTRNGSMFAYTSVGRLLRNPIAKGKHRRNYSKSLGNNKQWELKPEREWVWNDVPAVVSEKLWDQVNSILDERKKKYKKPGKSPSYLFTGLVYCECGKRMYVHNPKLKKYSCQTCKNRVPEEDLAKVFYAQFKEFWDSPIEVDDYLDQANDLVKERMDELMVLEKELESVTREMDKVYKLYVSDQITAEGFGKVYAPLELRHKQLENEIPTLQGEIDFLKIQYLSKDQIKNEAVSTYSLWPNGTFEERRKIVETVVHRIVVKKDTIVIDLAMPDNPPFFENNVNRHHIPGVVATSPIQTIRA